MSFKTLLKNKDVVRLLRVFSEEKLELNPTFKLGSGSSYPEVEKLMGENLEENMMFLEKLRENGVLHAEMVDKILCCPHCKSFSLLLRCLCVNCGSMNIDKKILLECLVCGTKFVESYGGAPITCFGCKTELKENMYNIVGTWFICSSCRKKFDDPLHIEHCIKCEKEFTVKEGILRNVYKYSLGSEAKPYLKKLNVAQGISEFLHSLGYDVSYFDALKGSSGYEHSFDIIASKRGDQSSLVVMDIAESESGFVAEDVVIKIFAKLLDVKIEKAILIALPRLSESSRKLAERYGVKVLEGSINEIMNKLRELFS